MSFDTTKIKIASLETGLFCAICKNYMPMQKLIK